MPGRKIPLVSDQIYHVFNRGINRQPTFTSRREYSRAIETINFYRFLNLPIRLSKLLVLSNQQQIEILNSLTEKSIEILAFCLMPNHFHFLLKQLTDNGISKFLSLFQNSYTRYFNTRNERDGSLFLDQFKAVLIETDEQLIHVSRYIHLNPYSSYVVKTIEELESYPWSSLPNYINNVEGSIDKNLILDLFKNPNEYKNFVFDNADYQRNLEKIKHLALE